jgi:hypothetical protein
VPPVLILSKGDGAVPCSELSRCEVSYALLLRALLLWGWVLASKDWNLGKIIDGKTIQTTDIFSPETQSRGWRYYDGNETQ